MTIIIGVVMVLMAAGAIAHPFWKMAQGRAAKRHLAGRDEGDMAWVAGEAMGKELESDYRSGILTKNEYEEMQSEHTPVTNGVAKETLRIKIDEEIEARVSQLRQSRRRVALTIKPSPAKEVDGAETVGGGGYMCPKCGEAYQERDIYCGYCGARLPPRGSAP